MLFLRRALVAALGIAFCTAAGPEPVDIDVMLSMTGPATFVGKTDFDSLSVLEKTVNKDGGIRGRPVHFVFHDDKTDPQLAVQLFNGLLERKPAVILGSSSVAPCRATLPLLGATGPVQYCLSPAIHPPSGSFMFSSSVSTRDCVAVLIRYFRLRGWKRIAVLSVTDSGGQDADANIAAALALPENREGGVSVVVHEHFNPNDITVAAQMSRLIAAKPQAAILWASGTPFATLLRGANEAGLDVPIGASNADMTFVQMKQYAAFLPKELLFPGLPYLTGTAPRGRGGAAQQKFFSAFADAGIRPDFIYSTSWDPALIVISALRALGPQATAEQLRTYLANLHGFSGVSGDYDFRDGSQRGLGERNIAAMRWDEARGTWTVVSRLGGEPLK
jgi:branched-chain amino acid transport system substrate-binding protein